MTKTLYLRLPPVMDADATLWKHALTTDFTPTLAACGLASWELLNGVSAQEVYARITNMIADLEKNPSKLLRYDPQDKQFLLPLLRDIREIAGRFPTARMVVSDG
jgi:hypothetical protein